ncbi:MAG: ATP-binding protein [Syntrophobacteraceae bacterium]|nr:HAMP domain-containing histidine kinase [Desulfobacteraceae bacterium]
MRLTIFWRIIFAQSALLALVLAVGLYALYCLNWITRLDTGILTVDSVCVGEEKRLLKVFLAEMRNAEKYLVSRDQAFMTAFVQGGGDFAEVLAKVTPLIDLPREKELLAEIDALHSRYVQGLHQAVSGKGGWDRVRIEAGDGILDRANELIRIREQVAADKTVWARDFAAEAARTVGWMIPAGIAGALLLAYLHALGVSRPLKRLAREMHRVGRGDFTPSPDSRACKEVHELSRSFNRMARELEQLDRLKADFTAHVSHELRTPLTAIREGTAILLEEIPGPLAEPQREILDVVRTNSERLFRSISSILDLSKMEAAMMEYEFAPCDISTLIRECVASVGPIAQGKRIDLRVNLPDSLPLLRLDEQRMRQVLENLLGNALKFTPEEGEVRVSAAIRMDGPAKGREVEVWVSDTGPGIPDEDLENVFQRFYQSSRSPGKRSQGTGLGLAIARHIVEAHGGRVWAERRSGGGATFSFTIPEAAAGGAA